jgi:hypothetical protein
MRALVFDGHLRIEDVESIIRLFSHDLAKKHVFERSGCSLVKKGIVTFIRLIEIRESSVKVFLLCTDDSTLNVNLSLH